MIGSEAANIHQEDLSLGDKTTLWAITHVEQLGRLASRHLRFVSTLGDAFQRI